MLVTFTKRAEHVVEVDPDIAFFGEEVGGSARFGIEENDVESVLLTVLALNPNTAIGGPADAGDVDIGLIAEIEPERVATVAVDDAEANVSVGGAGEGVAMVFLGASTDGVFALVHDAVDGNMGFIDFDEGDFLAVAGPPEAAVAGHLFLSGVFGEAVGFAGAAGAVGELARVATGGGEDVDFSVLDVGDPVAVGGECRVDGRG